MPIRPPASNGVLNAIYDALARDPSADGIHISIEQTAKPMKAKDGTVYSMKCLCWNLTAGGVDLGGKATLAVVHAGLEAETIRSDLARYFGDLACVVDNDIQISDE
jgi:hypothetical protein